MPMNDGPSDRPGAAPLSALAGVVFLIIVAFTGGVHALPGAPAPAAGVPVLIPAAWQAWCARFAGGRP